MSTTRVTPFSLRFLLKNKALNYPLFRHYLLTRFSLISGLNLQTAILVYWVFQITQQNVSVGKLGLAEAIPAICLSAISGYVADKREKRTLIVTCIGLYILLSAYFVVLALPQTLHHFGKEALVNLIYAGVFVGGCIRAFVSPSSFALLGLLIPRRLYQNGGTWSSMSWQSGAIIGTVVAGLMLALTNVAIALATVLAFVITAFFAAIAIPRQAINPKTKEPVLQSLREGLRFVFRTQVVLAALSLDMFAVLFGGATALLPYYADHVLHVSGGGYGLLRAAPGIGALVMFFVLAWVPLKTRPGVKLLFCIAGFGLATLLFGVSEYFVLSFAALLMVGMFDAVSVVIRGTILQLYTPDAMRGRVAAVNTMFISSSNEIGEVESGFTAKWMGAKAAVLFGGCMTLAVVAVTAIAAPRIRKLQLGAKAGEEAA